MKKVRGAMSKPYVFVDTDVFLHTVFDQPDTRVFDEILKKLDKDIILVIPEIIQREIEYKFKEIKNGWLVKVSNNLSTPKMLEIKQPSTKDQPTKGGQQTPEKIYDTASLDRFIETERINLQKKIAEYYEHIFVSIRKIMEHKNTKLIKLSDKLVIAGAKRSILKIAPYTNEKTGETAHTKDIDCIAFESLLSGLLPKTKISSIIMCVKDKDYCFEDGTLRDDINKELKKINNNVKSYKSLREFFKGEFAIQGNDEQEVIPDINITPTQTR